MGDDNMKGSGKEILGKIITTAVTFTVGISILAILAGWGINLKTVFLLF